MRLVSPLPAATDLFFGIGQMRLNLEGYKNKEKKKGGYQRRAKRKVNT